MYRSIHIALAAGVTLLASAAVPPMLPDSTTMNLSGSALAQKTPTTDSINLNSSRSNIYRKGTPGGTTAPNKPLEAATVNTSKSNNLRKAAPGNGQQPPTAVEYKDGEDGVNRVVQPLVAPTPAQATTIKSSKSNASD